MKHDKKSEGGGAEGDGDDAQPHQDQGAIVPGRGITDADHEMQSAKELGEEPDHDCARDSRPICIEEAMEYQVPEGMETEGYGRAKHLVDAAMEHGRDLPHFLCQGHKFLRQDGLDSVGQSLFRIVMHFDQQPVGAHRNSGPG